VTGWDPWQNRTVAGTVAETRNLVELEVLAAEQIEHQAVVGVAEDIQVEPEPEPVQG